MGIVYCNSLILYGLGTFKLGALGTSVGFVILQAGCIMDDKWPRLNVTRNRNYWIWQFPVNLLKYNNRQYPKLLPVHKLPKNLFYFSNFLNRF